MFFSPVGNDIGRPRAQLPRQMRRYCYYVPEVVDPPIRDRYREPTRAVRLKPDRGWLGLPIGLLKAIAAGGGRHNPAAGRDADVTARSV
jgi:hypothetical protein